MQIIIHRVNTLEKLRRIPHDFGVEIDLRAYGSKIYLSHDPIDESSNYLSFEKFLKNYDNKTLVLNVKESGLEDRIISIVEEYGIQDYFLLDIEFPYIFDAVKNSKTRKIALRFSEAEPIEMCTTMIHNDNTSVDWIWIDTNTILPINPNNVKILTKFKTCLVCPERWGRPHDIKKYKKKNERNGF